MDFSLTKEQQLVQDMARELARNDIKPRAANLDREHGWPSENLKQMAELGLLGMMIPEEWGGAGMDTVSYVLALEEIAAACASTAVIMGVHNSLICDPLHRLGTQRQKEKYLTDAAQGKFIGCFALTEPNAGSDVTRLATTAEKVGSEYILNGSKIFISMATHAELALVMATTDRQKGTRGISAFLVESNFNGYKVGTVENKMGLHASGTAELYFDNCRVPEENRLGEEGLGLIIALSSLDCGRVGVAAQALGISQAALDDALKYSQQRVQFGKPICNFQGIQWKLADMQLRLEAARLLTHKAAWLRDQGQRITKAASLAKLAATEAASFITHQALQIHGGYGYMKDYDVERYFRDARVTEIYEGSSEIQRNTIAKEMLR